MTHLEESAIIRFSFNSFLLSYFTGLRSRDLDIAMDSESLEGIFELVPSELLLGVPNDLAMALHTFYAILNSPPIRLFFPSLNFFMLQWHFMYIFQYQLYFFSSFWVCIIFLHSLLFRNSPLEHIFLHHDYTPMVLRLYISSLLFNHIHQSEFIYNNSLECDFLINTSVLCSNCVGD